MALTAKAVKAIGYVGVGTLEFLLDQDGRFWFMEMNLRLQVEHGVTEMLTNVDLVKWQIRTGGRGVPELPPANVVLDGACLECRINATRPGTVTVLHVPGGPFVRFDTYLVAGLTVSPYYDSLLGKLIVRAGTPGGSGAQDESRPVRAGHRRGGDQHRRAAGTGKRSPVHVRGL